MTITEVLHALVDRLPKDWVLDEYHKAIDEHFEQPDRQPTPAPLTVDERFATPAPQPEVDERFATPPPAFPPQPTPPPAPGSEAQ